MDRSLLGRVHEKPKHFPSGYVSSTVFALCAMYFFLFSFSLQDFRFNYFADEFYIKCKLRGRALPSNEMYAANEEV